MKINREHIFILGMIAGIILVMLLFELATYLTQDVVKFYEQEAFKEKDTIYEPLNK